MKKLVAASAALCALAAPAAHAQDIIGLNPAGHASLRWGADSAAVANHWREQPLAVKREGAVARLSFLPWLGMDSWTVAVHDQHGFVQAEAVSGANLTGAQCELRFREMVALVRRSYPRLAPVSTERNDAGPGLCEAVKAGRGEARYQWADPANGARTRVEVNPQGRVVFETGAPQYREWLAASGAPAAPVAAAPRPAQRPAAAAQAARARLGITAAGFAALRPGMSLDEVNTTLGSAGTQASSTAAAGMSTAGYTWRGTGGAFIIVSFLNGRVAGGVQGGLYPAPRAAAAATLAKFDQLREGMTREEVARIMGAPGNLTSFTDMGGRMMLGYSWPGPSLGSTAIASFIEGRLMSRTQVGLR